MKRIATIIAVFVLAISAFAQDSNDGLAPYRAFGQAVASAYGKWQIPAPQGAALIAGANSVTLPSGTCSISVSGKNIIPFATNAPLKIVDAVSANTETVTVSSFSVTNAGCVVGFTSSNAHNSYYFTSGTGGLQEAINDLSLGGVVIITPGFTVLGGTDTILSAAVLKNVPVVFQDVRTGFTRYWAYRPSAITLISAPAAPTVTVASGSLSSGQYYAKVAYVDALGGISAASADSAQTAATTGMVITSPAASTGAVGWLPYITAAGGGTGTEILAQQTITSAGCTLTTLETVIAACAIGSNWSSGSLSNPSSTSKVMVEPNAFSTYKFVPVSHIPPPFMTTFPFGVFTATATLNSGGTANADAAQFQLPAGYMNILGKGFRVCFKAATATQVASSTLTVALTVSTNYAQSPVTLGSFAFGTYTQGAAGTQTGCFDVVTSTTGASGKFFVSAPGPAYNILNSATTTFTGATAEVSAAETSAVDLTKQLYFAINLADGTANNITGPIINDLRITLLQ